MPGVFDMPPQTVQRYQVENVVSPFCFWRFNHKRRRMSAGTVLRVEVLARASIHWSVDDWQTLHDSHTTDTQLGGHFADLPTDRLLPGSAVRFTFLWLNADRWEGVDFDVMIEGTMRRCEGA